MEQDIKNLVAELELSEYIKMPGLQTDTVSYFSAMDIFMMSSAFEGLPVALLEAMSMECAVVSTKAGGVVEVIEHDRSGLLCDVGDWNALGLNLCELVKDQEQRRFLQQQAREKVKTSFSLSSMVDKLENNYLKLLNYEN